MLGMERRTQFKEIFYLYLHPRFSCFCCHMLTFFEKFFQEHYISECQTNWAQMRNDRILVLIWVQTVCKGFRQKTKVAASKKRLKVVATLAGSAHF